MAAPCLHASGARQGVPRLKLRAPNKHIRCSAAKAAVKSNSDAHSRMDLGQQWQREMNYERVDNAREIQKRKAEIEKAVEHQLFSRASFFKDATHASDSMDALAQAVTIQSRLNEAVEKQDYSLAATLRDELKAAKDRTEVPAEEDEKQKFRFELGQRVLVQDESLKDPLPAVVVGWDACCAENDEWKERNDLGRLDMGEKQPFYHLVIDSYAWKAAGWETVMVPCAYVPQELLCAPADEGSTWIEKYTGSDLEPFSHPYQYMLFLGQDNAGDFIPVPELRNFYGVARKDVYPPEGDTSGEGSGSEGESPDGDAPKPGEQ